MGDKMPEKMPVFVKLEDYKDVLDIVEIMKDRVKHARTILQKITELKTKEDQQLDTWDKELQEVEGRVNEIDKALLEPQTS